MDKIICDAETYKFISQWYVDNNIVIQELPIVLKEFSVEGEVSEGKYWVNFDCLCREDGSIHISNFKVIGGRLLNTLPDCDFIKTEIPLVTGSCKFRWDIICDKPLDKETETLGFCMIYYITYVIYFMANFEPELIEYVVTETTKKKKKKSKSQPKLIQTQVIKLDKFAYDVKTGKKQLKRHYNKCQYSFGVKGHYRTYKSGKRVWIKPFTKNTLENKLKRSKEYRFNLKRN